MGTSSTKATALKSLSNKDNLRVNPGNLNLRLKLEPVQSVTANESFPLTQRTAVILAFLDPPKPATSQAIDDSSLYRIVVVTAQGIETFCLLTGNRGMRTFSESPGHRINAAVQLEAGALGKGIVLCNEIGAFKFIDIVSLQIRTTFGAAGDLTKMKLERDQVTAMVALESDKLVVGHLNGKVEIWVFGAAEPTVTFNSLEIWEMPGVTKLAYSQKIKTVFSGHDSGYTNKEGRFFKLQEYEIRLYSIDFAAETETQKSKSSQFPGFVGSCYQLAVSDSHNLAIALSSEANKVFLWSIKTFKLVFTFSLPNLLESAALATSFSLVHPGDGRMVLTFGMSDGATVVSQLALGEDLRLNWTPLKLIRQKNAGTKKLDKRQVEFIDYDSLIDILVLGDQQSHLRLINNFLYETATKPTTPAQEETNTPEETKETPKRKSASEETIQRIRKRVEVKKPEDDSSAFGVFLKKRKDELQLAFPDKPYKDILLEISEEWSQLPPDARRAYDPSSEESTSSV